MIPSDQVDAALRAGGKRAVKMSDPKGTQRWVPEDRVQDATKAGGKVAPDSSDELRTPAQRLFGSDPRSAFINAAKNMAEHTKGAVTGALHTVTDEPKNAQEKVASYLGPGGLALDRMFVEPTTNAISEAAHQAHAGNVGADIKDPYDAEGNYHPTAVSSAIDAIPVAGPWARNIESEAHKQGAIPALVGAATDVAVPELVGKFAPHVITGAKDFPGKTQRGAARIVTPRGAADGPIPEDPASTYRDRYSDAKDIGVDLDLAQAGGGRLAKTAKTVTEHSTLGGPSFRARAAKNVNALHVEAENMLDRITPQHMSREQFGNFAKSKLLEHAQMIQDHVQEIFDDLTKRAGASHPDMEGVRDQAHQIIAENDEYFKKHPQLLKGGVADAWKNLQNLAKGPEVPAPVTVTSPIVDEGGRPITRTVQPETPKGDTWSDLQKVRSDLMNLYRSPDIVGSRAEGWLKQMTGSVDEAMTGEPSGLPPDAVAQFREGNEIFKKLKDTYDNPQNPFYSVIRAPEGLTAADTIAGLKPEAMRTLNEAAIATDTPELVQQAQRQKASRLLSPAGNDVPDLERFHQRWTRQPKEQLSGVLTPDQMADMDRFARVSRPVFTDTNPSGTAKVIQPLTEVGSAGVALGHGNVLPAVGMVAEGAAAKAMTSPKLVDAMMNPPTPKTAPVSTPDAGTVAPAVIPVTDRQDNKQADVPELTPAGGPTIDEKTVVPADDRGVREVRLPVVVPKADDAVPAPTHPLGAVTGIDHDSGLPIVKRDAAPSPPPVAKPVAAPERVAPQASVEDLPMPPHTHVFDRELWLRNNPGGDHEAAADMAKSAGYEVA